MKKCILAVVMIATLSGCDTLSKVRVVGNPNRAQPSFTGTPTSPTELQGFSLGTFGTVAVFVGLSVGCIALWRWDND